MYTVECIIDSFLNNKYNIYQRGGERARIIRRFVGAVVCSLCLCGEGERDPVAGKTGSLTTYHLRQVILFSIALAEKR